MTVLSNSRELCFYKHGSREQNKLLTTPSCVDKFLSFKINDLFQITQKPQCCLNRATFFNYTYSKLIKQQKETKMETVEELNNTIEELNNTLKQLYSGLSNGLSIKFYEERKEFFINRKRLLLKQQIEIA